MKKTKAEKIYFFDTYTRSKRVFVPLVPKKAKIYTCGPTVYDYAHIGNLRAYVFADSLRRLLEANGFEVFQVINITDVGHLTSEADQGEDKLEAKARETGRLAQEIAEFYTQAFKKDIKRLNIQEPQVWPKASEHIADQIALIKKLESKGYTYQTSDGLYFDTAKFPAYGRLARLRIGKIKAGARVRLSLEKRQPTDFALWKFSPTDKKRQMEWPSPWGVGFPGWHIECAAMAMKYLGPTLDIHTGGIDHIPIHHTNEIAQAEAATGQQFSRYWLHVGFLTVNGEKISKSKKNFIILEELIKRNYNPLALRYLFLTAAYRSPLNFTWLALQGAQKSLDKLYGYFKKWPKSGQVDQQLLSEFKARINNDLDTPRALAFLWKVVKLSLPQDVKRATLEAFDKFLGLGLKERPQLALPPKIKKLVEIRNKLRKEKKWAEADEVRGKIEKAGYLIEDRPEGALVKKKPR